jgi:hypothetical protein
MTRYVFLAWQPTCHVESRSDALTDHDVPPRAGGWAARLLREGLPLTGEGYSAGLGRPMPWK